MGHVHVTDHVRLRLYVGGSVVYEDTWRLSEGVAQMDRIMRKYSVAVKEAERDGLLYAIEIHDPHGPPDHHTARWGSDPSVMDNPSPLALPVANALGIHYGDGCMDLRHHAEGGCFTHSLN